jgi:hypothetical protein
MSLAPMPRRIIDNPYGNSIPLKRTGSGIMTVGIILIVIYFLVEARK